MSADGVHGDHVTLQRAVEMFNMNSVGLSPEGLDHTVVTCPPVSPLRYSSIKFGHLPEDHGEQYVSLVETIDSHLWRADDADVFSRGDVNNACCKASLKIDECCRVDEYRRGDTGHARNDEGGDTDINNKDDIDDGENVTKVVTLI